MPLETSTNQRDKIGLAYWMERVGEECNRVLPDFAPDPVHDLRVALRRCRSMADGFMALDPNPGWRGMKKASRLLFRQLAELRDAHVMINWVKRLQTEEETIGKALIDLAVADEERLRNQASEAVQSFDSREWILWGKSLPKRAARVPLDGVVFKHLALEHWREARDLHRQALRNRTKIALHRVRIGLKKFRYTMENFLPRMYERWGQDLKEIQDLLGEIHDLDVLWATVLKISPGVRDEAKTRWRTKIEVERKQRLEQYRTRMLGRDSLWQHWRSDLPKGDALQTAVLMRLKIWAEFRDPDFRHSQHVTQLALEIYDGLGVDRFLGNASVADTRLILKAAALTHDVGRSKGNKKHHKHSYRFIRKIRTLVGWRQEDLQLAAIVARYHRGALPAATHSGFRSLVPTKHPLARFLCGVLRLADALDRQHDRSVRRLRVEKTDDFIRILADGYSHDSSIARSVASARYLLEIACEKPILVCPLT